MEIDCLTSSYLCMKTEFRSSSAENPSTTNFAGRNSRGCNVYDQLHKRLSRPCGRKENSTPMLLKHILTPSKSAQPQAKLRPFLSYSQAVRNRNQKPTTANSGSQSNLGNMLICLFNKIDSMLNLMMASQRKDTTKQKYWSEMSADSPRVNLNCKHI